MTAPAKDLWNFEKLQENADFGVVEVSIDDGKVRQWTQIFGQPQRAVPDGLLVAAMMEGFIKAIQPRPKGNIHVSQSLAFSGSRPSPGDVVSVHLLCARKEIKRGRYWVWFDVVVANAGAVSMTGQICTIWAE